MKNFFYSILIIFLFSIEAKAQEDKLLSGIDHIYKLQFDSAEMIFNETVRNNPEDPAGYFFLAMIDWWKINVDKENEEYDDAFFDRINKSVDIADNRLDKNENDERALFFKGGALGYRGLVNAFRESWFKAASDGKDALNLLKKASDINPNNKDVIFGVGIYNYFADYVPERNPVVKPLMIIFPKGDKEKGLMQIRETAQNSNYASNEARFVYVYLNLNYEKNYWEAERYSKELHEKYPDNPVFEKYLYQSYVGMQKWNEALDGWKKILEKNTNNVFGYNNKVLKRDALYYLSLSLNHLGKLGEAEQYLNEGEEISKQLDGEEGSAYMAHLYLLKGKFLQQKGDQSLASFYFDRVLQMKDFQNSHETARKLSGKQ